MTLDQAMDAFESKPNRKTANQFAKVAKQYYYDEMISVDTCAAIAARLEAAGFKNAMLNLMK